MKAVAKTIPMKRMGTPEDIANACIFLSSCKLIMDYRGTAIEVHGGGESPAYSEFSKTQIKLNYLQAKNFISTSFYPHIFLSNLLPQKNFIAPFISL